MPQSRVALVAVETQGGSYRTASGYLLGKGLVLTARHAWAGKVDGDPAPVQAEVRFEGGDWIRTKLEWLSSKETDSCLLRIVDAVPEADTGLTAFGAFDKTIAIDCECSGYPGAASDSAKNLRYLSDVGRGSLGAGGGTDHHELAAAAAPPSPEDWLGMSGAAVLAEGRVVGHVRTVPAGFAGQRLWVTPIERVIQESGRLPGVDVPLVPSGGLSTNIEVRYLKSIFSRLEAKYCEVPFSSELRKSEWDRLKDWCAGDSPVELMLLSGPSGTGKTPAAHRVLSRDARPAMASGLCP